MKNKFKKLTGFFFAAVMTLVALPIQTFASEWGVGDNVYAAMLGNYIGSDGGTYGDKYNYDYIYYKSDGSVGTATRYASTHAKLGVSKNGVTQQAICIEAGVSYSTGSSYVGNSIMGKMSELASDLSELKHCGEVLISLSESIMALISGEDTQQPVDKPSAKKKSDSATVSVTLENVRAVCAEKSRAGFTAEVKSIITKHGADKLSAIKPEEYAAVLAEVEVLGNAD